MTAIKKCLRLILPLILPLTIILFGTVTKWHYVKVEDGASDFLYGFPLAYMCNGWNTSGSLQIFLAELIFDFAVYFAICLVIVLAIQSFFKPIIVKKFISVVLYGISTLIVLFYGMLFSNPNNVFETKRNFKCTEVSNGYKFMWQQNKR
ncbi:MAG: hypothetical protein EOP00_25710 [Pedobacter sp.]|nr:MAG: hypothetical protein EOP00_25710 [Pedobacter sp.]